VAGFLSGAGAPSDQGSIADGLEPRPTGSGTTAPTRLTFTHTHTNIVKMMYDARALTLTLILYLCVLFNALLMFLKRGDGSAFLPVFVRNAV